MSNKRLLKVNFAHQNEITIVTWNKIIKRKDFVILEDNR